MTGQDDTTGLTGRIEALSPQRRALLERLRRQRDGGIVAGPPQAEPPMSFAQRRMWFLDQYDPGSAAYVIYEAVRISGPLDPATLDRALAGLCRRHQVLRSTYLLRAGELVQTVTDTVPRLESVDLGGEPDPDGEAMRRAGELARQPFDLATGPLVRATLFRLRDGEHLLVLTMHHIASDGWSMGVLLTELTALYDAFAAGRPDPLPAPAIQYADYAGWQRDRLTGPLLQRELEHWRTELAGAPGVLELPTDSPRPARPSGHGDTEDFTLDAELVRAVGELARAEGATPFMVLLTAFHSLLARWSGVTDLCVGTPVANRTRAETEELIGFFVNTLVLRADLSGEPSFREALRRVRESTLRAYEHQEMPFERLVEELQPARDARYAPLVQVMFALQNAPLPGLGTRELRIDRMPLHNGTAKFDLALFLTAEGDGLASWVEYATELFDPATARRFTRQYTNLLRAVVAAPDRPLWEAELLDAADRRTILQDWNATAVERPHAGWVPERIAEQAARVPDQPAVVFGDTTLTYRDLERRTASVAAALRARGAGPGAVVGVCLDRSIDLVVALVGVLRSGAAYLPIDPAYPAERREYMARDAGAITVIDGLDGLEGTAELPAPAGGDLAYIIYTSGSTGRPKAVMSTHEGLLNRLEWMQESYRLTAADRVLQKTPATFDVSVWEFFWPLLTGACLVVAEPGAHRDPERLVNTIVAHGVTTMHFVPSMLRPFLDEPRATECTSLRTVIASGEALPTALARRCAERLPAATLSNLYGPTEASIDVTAHTFRPDAAYRGPTVPIGHPIANTVLRILDERLRPVPVGIAGELYLGGIGLARGYLGRPDLTAERFVPDPFGSTPGARLYRTGDRARSLPDGEVEYLDRVDRQLKIRGFRVEPGEIEAVLGEHPEVSAAAVVARDGRLAGYVAPPAGEAAPGIQALRDFLRARLPEHLVPATIAVLPRLPQTVSGKIDRGALPEPGEARPDVVAYTPPADDAEELLAAVWTRVLGLDRVGVEDNIFTIGADSIRCLEVLSLARERGLELSLPQMFEHQTIRSLVTATRNAEPAPDGPAAAPFGLLADADRDRLPAGVEDAYPLSGLQAGMIFDSEADGNYSIYHDVFSFHLRGRFDAAALTEAVARVVARHPVLRTSIDLDGYSEPLQLVHREVAVPVPVTDLRDLSPADTDAAITTWLAAESETGFTWSQPPLVRFQAHLRDDDSFQATMSCSNVVLDGWSVASMLTEIFRGYAALRDGHAPPDATLPASSFRRFVELEREAVADPGCREFWDRTLRPVAGAEQPLPLDDDGERPRRVRRVHEVGVDAGVDAGLRRLARQAAVPLKSVLFAAHLWVTQVGNGPAPALTGMVTNGRPEEPDGERVLGLFLNVVPVVNEPAAGTWTDLVRRAFEAERAVLPFRRHPANRMRAGDGSTLRLDVAFNFVRFHVYELLAGVEGLSVLDADLFDDTNIPLWVEFSVNPATDRTSLTLTYDAAATDPARAEVICARYAEVLAAMAADPDAEAGLPRLSDQEYQAVVHTGNDTAVDLPADWSIPGLFEQQVARTPQAPAFVCGDRTLTFDELNRQANRLAHRLRALGVRRDTPVGVHLRRSLDVPVALLGVLKAGGAYLPLDAAYPAERLALMLADAAVPVVLTTGELAAGLPASDAQVVTLDTDDPAVSDADPGVPVAPDDLAYLIFTSGSTGRPKGVAVEHRQILNRLAWMWQEYPFADGELSAQKTSLGFVDSFWELLGPVLRGVPTVIIPDSAVSDPPELVEQLARHRVTRLWLVPTLLRALLDSDDALRERLPALDFWVTSGEPLPSDLLRRFDRQLPGATLFNLYGTSEIWDVTWFDPTGEPARAHSVPIGKPIWNMRCYVLDEAMRPLPVDVPGELYVGGVGLARGYWDAPELTAERFVPDPFAAEPGGRLYRTGDLARVLPSGDILHLGRADRQLKIRGQRVEPAEVEALLRDHPGVRDTAVVGHRPRPGDDLGLAAYVVAEPGHDKADVVEALRGLCRERLPAHLRPSWYVPMTSWPLTTSGKLDRRLLPPVPEHSGAPAVESGGAPRGPLEELLCALAADSLGLPSIGVHDDFFEHGGDSLWVMRFAARVRRASGRSVPVADVFAAPTVGALAKRLGPGEDAAGSADEPIRPVPRDGRTTLPVSSAQRRLWLVHELAPDDPSYNVHAAVRLAGPVDLATMRAAVEAIVRRHESLRTTFEFDGTEPVQRVSPDLGPGLRELDLSGTGDDRLRAEILAEIRQPFDLARGPLLRALLIRVGPDDHVAVVTAHHIACDAWSMEVFVSELSALYRADPLPPLEVQYADYAAWQRARLDQRAHDQLAEFWRARLDGAPALLDLPSSPAGSEHRGGTRDRLLDDDLHQAVRQLAARSGATLFMALLAAFGVVLRRHTGRDDLVIGTDVAGRDDPVLDELIGFFVNQLPLRVDLSGDPAYADLLERTRTVALDAYAHRELPFDQLVEAVRPARETGRPPVFQVKLVLQNVPERGFDLPGITVSRIPVERGTAQLDLNLRAAATPDGLVLSAEYAADRVAASTVDLILFQLEALLRSVAANPAVPLADLDALLDKEAQRYREESGTRARQRLRTARRQQVD